MDGGWWMAKGETFRFILYLSSFQVWVVIILPLFAIRHFPAGSGTAPIIQGLTVIAQGKRRWT
jgi:hypothetical protein